MSEQETPIIIFGSGRSGTTWIMDVLAESNNLRTIFEPLHPDAVSHAEKYADKSVRSEASEEELFNLMREILNGGIQNVWTKYRVRPDRLMPGMNKLFNIQSLSKLKYQYKKLCHHFLKFRNTRGDRIVVKFIRANLMQRWIVNHFDVKTIYVLRHPAAVINSKMMLRPEVRIQNWDFLPIIKKYRSDNDLLSAYSSLPLDILFEPLTEVSAYTVIWCIENIVPLNEAQKLNSCFVFYEDLLANPDREWKKIIHALSLENMPSEELVGRPSMEASKDMKNKQFTISQINGWKRSLNSGQLEEIQTVLDYFKFKTYSVHEPFPKTNLEN